MGRGGEVHSIFPYRVPYFQLRRMVSLEVAPTTPDFYVEYLRPAHAPGRLRFEACAGRPTPDSDAHLARPPPLLLQKLTAFKSVLVDDGDVGVCHGP